jgi:hypothetical protein
LKLQFGYGTDFVQEKGDSSPFKKFSGQKNQKSDSWDASTVQSENFLMIFVKLCVTFPVIFHSITNTRKSGRIFFFTDTDRGI